MKKWGHNELADDLAKHLRGNSDRVVWTDMQMGPSGSPRPDVYTLLKSYSKFTPLAYECKISTADFRRDVTAGKWQSYLQFAAGVIFAAPAGLIKKEDVPPGCGLIVRHGDVWRTVKGPTLKAIETLPRDAWMKLIIDGIVREHQRTVDPQPRLADSWNTERALRKKYGNEIAEAFRDMSMARFSFERKRQELAKSTEDLEAEQRERMEHARRRVEEELKEVRQHKIDLCKALGLPETASTWQIWEAVHAITRRIAEEGEVKHLRDHMSKVQRELDAALKAIPMSNPPEAEAA